MGALHLARAGKLFLELGVERCHVQASELGVGVGIDELFLAVARPNAPPESRVD